MPSLFWDHHPFASRLLPPIPRYKRNENCLASVVLKCNFGYLAKPFQFDTDLFRHCSFLLKVMIGREHIPLDPTTPRAARLLRANPFRG